MCQLSPWIVVFAFFLLSACTTDSTSSSGASSFRGAPLPRLPIATERLSKLEADLAAAEEDLRANPRSVEALVWRGRRLGYLGRFEDAIDTYTQGLLVHPNHPKLLRHRGHRFITLRDFDRAVVDLDRAARQFPPFEDEVEPDGQPNDRNQPRTTLLRNIHYHLGLAHYLRGEFRTAATHFERGAGVHARNGDDFVSFGHWLALSRMRAGDSLADATNHLNPLPAPVDVWENHSYFRLCQRHLNLLSDATAVLGLAPLSVDEATVTYGLAARYLASGRATPATPYLDLVLANPNPTSFGFIAAEADRSRLLP